MKLIIGLGNPGEKYKNTRHNIGFMFLDFLKEKYSFENFNYESKFKGEISNGKINSQKIILLKPQTFMNLSGESVRKIIDYFKIDLENLLVVYDDISINFGQIRFRHKGSPGGHNGIKDINKYIGQDYDRMKIGIGLDSKYSVSDWVLSKFKEEELIEIDNGIFNKSEEVIIKNFIDKKKLGEKFT